MKVLIADDDVIQLEILQSLLESQGYEVLTAINGLEALNVIHEQSPQFVLSDWNMPELDGVSLCRAVRAEHRANYIYFILLTSRKSREDVIAGIEAGADDFMVKPFDTEELTVRMKAGKRILAMETRHVTIFALAKLAESRDPETGLHLERMREFSKLLAQYVIQQHPESGEHSRDYAEMIYLTSPLHDIGKVGIPDVVLLKPGRLTESEFNIMKLHSTIGGETLSAAVEQYPNVEYLHMARDIAWAHHERWDGSGYPRGLVGEAIPLSARIVALADVYDALTSKRVYKSAMEHDIARGIILDGRGKHFDPQVVDAYLALELLFVDIKNKLSEVKENERLAPI